MGNIISIGGKFAYAVDSPFEFVKYWILAKFHFGNFQEDNSLGVVASESKPNIGSGPVINTTVLILFADEL